MLWFGLLACGACTEPEIDVGKSQGDLCTMRNECGAGLVCDVEDAVCVESYTNKNGVFKEKIVLGASLALTGGIQDLGQGMALGMRAYFDHINKVKGGVHGRQIELRVYDDGYEVNRAKQNTEQMIKGSDREVFAVIGNVGSPTAAVAVPLHNENKVIFFGPYTGAGVTRKDPPERYIFNFRASYVDEAQALSNYFLTGREPAVGAVNVGLFAQADVGSAKTGWERLDSYGLDGFLGLAGALKLAGNVEKGDIFVSSYERGTSVVDDAVEETIRWMASPDRKLDRDGVSVTVALLLQSTANAGVGYVTGVKNELRAVKANGTSKFNLGEEDLARLKRVTVVFAATSPAGDKMPIDLKMLQDSTKQYCEGMIFSQVVPLTSSGATGVTNYREQLKAFDPNAIYGFASLEGYFAARLFVEALEAAGPELTDDVMIDALESLQGVDLGIGTSVSFSPNQHQASTKVWGSILGSDCQYSDFSIE